MCLRTTSNTLSARRVLRQLALKIIPRDESLRVEREEKKRRRRRRRRSAAIVECALRVHAVRFFFSLSVLPVCLSLIIYHVVRAASLRIDTRVVLEVVSHSGDAASGRFELRAPFGCFFYIFYRYLDQEI